MKRSSCHPDRNHYAKGLCKQCYSKNYESVHQVRLKHKRTAYYSKNRIRILERNNYYYSKNAQTRIDKQKIYRKINKDYISDRLRFNKYGLSKDEYETMIKIQGGSCAICKRNNDFGGRGNKLHVDHNHNTGVVRGLLCNKCNAAIGLLNEDCAVIENALSYLRDN